MAHKDTPIVGNVVVSCDLGSPRRTIGGLLGQLDLAGLDRDECIEILLSVGLPAAAYDDPTFPISIAQDFGILDHLCQRLPRNASLEVSLFRQARLMRAYMFGALGMAWQSAPTMLDGIKVLVDHPQANWGRSSMVYSVSDAEEVCTYTLERAPAGLEHMHDPEATLKYALLLDVVAAVGLFRDVVQDRSLLTAIHIPFSRPPDWSKVSRQVPYKIEFDAPVAALVYKPGYLRHVPARAHHLSFKMAVKLVQKEAEILADEGTLQDRVRRWLWAYSPPLKKTEIAKLLGMSDRSLTRRLADEGTNYNELLGSVQSERARNLLSRTGLSVSQVGYRMGFSDPAAFARAFSGWFGMSPSQWRKQHDC